MIILNILCEQNLNTADYINQHTIVITRSILIIYFEMSVLLYSCKGTKIKGEGFYMHSCNHVRGISLCPRNGDSSGFHREQEFSSIGFYQYPIDLGRLLQSDASCHKDGISTVVTATVTTDFRRALLTASFEFSRAIGFRGSWLELPTRDDDVPTFLREDKHFAGVIFPPPPKVLFTTF